MVSSLLAGIKPLLAVDRGGLLPESLTRKKKCRQPFNRWPASNRNGGRLQIGIPGRIKSGSSRKARRKRDVDNVWSALTNVLSIIYPHVYFPTYSNNLNQQGGLDCSNLGRAD